jgi:hypothetical protein
MPALFTTMSMRPNLSTAAATIWWAAFQSATEPPSTSAWPPADSITRTTSSAGCSPPTVPSSDAPRSLTTTFAPACARAERDRAAEPAAAAGDERHLAFQ